MHRKGLVIGILLMMLGVNIGNTFAGDVEVKTMSPVSFDGNTLYVGGSGEGNYTTIQSAINDSSDGDTVFVYNGTYVEFLTIDKSITLRGEDTDGTTITVDEDPSYHIIEVTSDTIVIDSFTIEYAGPDKSAIHIITDNNEIMNCKIERNGGQGIIIDDSTNNLIINCAFYSNPEAILIQSSEPGLANNNEIDDCIFEYNNIRLYQSTQNYLIDSRFYDCDLIIDENSDGTNITNCRFTWKNEIASIIIKASDTIIDNCEVSGDFHDDGIIVHGEYGVKNTQITNSQLAFMARGIIFYNDTSGLYMNRCSIEMCEEVGIVFFGNVINTEISQCEFNYNWVGIEFNKPCFFNRFIQNNFETIFDETIIQVNAPYMFNIWRQNYWGDYLGIGPYHVFGLFNWDLSAKRDPYDWSIAHE